LIRIYLFIYNVIFLYLLELAFVLLAILLRDIMQWIYLYMHWWCTSCANHRPLCS